MRTGTCFCGAVRYQVKGDLAAATRCHCSRCRKAFSGAGSAMSLVQPGQFSWLAGEDLVKCYGVEMGLGFCTTCGSTLVGYRGEDVLGITLGTLDDDEGVEVGRHIIVGSMACWDAIGDDAPQFEAWPDEV